MSVKQKKPVLEVTETESQRKRVINPATERRVNRTREDVGRLMATRVEGVQHTCHVYAENLGLGLLSTCHIRD